MRRRWTKAEDEAIRAAVGKTAPWDIRRAARLADVAREIGRTAAAVMKRARQIGAFSHLPAPYSGAAVWGFEMRYVACGECGRLHPPGPDGICWRCRRAGMGRVAGADATRWGAAVRVLLRERGMTQKELATAAGVRPNTIGDIVRHGKHTTTATLERIAAALDVDVVELMMTPGQRALRREWQQDAQARRRL